MTAVKFIEEEGEWYIEGLALPFGGPMGGNDLTGTRFTKSTDFCLEWFPDGGRPILYGHGYDSTLGTTVVGREVRSWEDDKGRWMRAQIDKRHEYAKEIRQLVEDGHLSFSSGAVDHLVRVAKDGSIRMWPWVEESLVPNPANPDAAAYTVKSADAVARIRITSPDAPAVRYSESAADASQGAYILASLLSLLGDESDDVGDGPQHLKNAIAELQAWMALEVAEIGTPEDVAESAIEAMSDAYLSYHRDAARRSTPTPTDRRAHPQAEPAPVLSIKGGDRAEPLPVDVARLLDRAEEVGAAKARDLLRVPPR